MLNALSTIAGLKTLYLENLHQTQMKWLNKYQARCSSLIKILEVFLLFTVVVEQAFSARGSILDQTHSSMPPKLVKAQACLDDWTKVVLN